MANEKPPKWKTEYNKQKAKSLKKSEAIIFYCGKWDAGKNWTFVENWMRTKNCFCPLHQIRCKNLLFAGKVKGRWRSHFRDPPALQQICPFKSVAPLSVSMFALRWPVNKRQTWTTKRQNWNKIQVDLWLKNADVKSAQSVVTQLDTVRLRSAWSCLRTCKRFDPCPNLSE